jgi:hypothetical protein
VTTLLLSRPEAALPINEHTLFHVAADIQPETHILVDVYVGF